MKLERLPEYVLPVVVTLCGMGMAVVMGYFMGQGRISYVVGLIVALLLGSLTLGLRQNIWLLIMFGWPITGSIPLLPFPFAVRDLLVAATFCSFLMLMALKVIRLKPRYDTMDYLMWAVLLYLVTVFIRNPVGTEATGSTRVGGRPYFNVLISCMCYWVLCRSEISRAWVKVPILLSLVANYGIGLLNVVADFFPRTMPVLANFYTGIVGADALNNQGAVTTSVDSEQSRFMYLNWFGLPSIQALLSYYRPLTLINPLYFGRFTLFLISGLLLMLSGFRSSILMAIFVTSICALIRGGWHDLIRLGVIAAFGLTLLIAGNGRIFHLPFAAQRALCFLPGKWDPIAVADAHRSTEWRIEMWREYLRGNRYVQNHFLGDGFGFSKRDLDIIAALSLQGGGDDQESMMIVGNIHNGPLSAIRAVGYVGLAMYLVLTIFIATRAWKMIKRTAGTPFLPLALFVGLPAIYDPFSFVFVYGAFDVSLPAAVFNVAMLKMMENSIFTQSEPTRPTHEAAEVDASKLAWRRERRALTESGVSRRRINESAI